MRDAYHIPSGNPVRLDGLPTSRPDLELPPPLKSKSLRRDEAFSYCLAAVGVSFVVPIVFLLPGWSWLEPFDLLLAGPTLLIACLYAVMRRRITPLLKPVPQAAVLLLCLNPSLPWPLRAGLIAAAQALHVYAFGRHGVAALTVAPVPIDRSRSLRRSARITLTALALVIGLTTASLLVWDTMFARVALLTLPVMLLVRPSGGGTMSRWRTISDCVSSWLHHDNSLVPGVLASPVGDRSSRVCLSLQATALSALVLVAWPGSCLPAIVSGATAHHEIVANALDAESAPLFLRVRYLSVGWLGALAVVLLIPVLLPWAVTLSAASTVLFDAGVARATESSVDLTAAALRDLPHSSDATERESVYLGRVVSDGSPCLIPRKLYSEHAHVLGDSGSGKTSLFLAPHIEQLAARGDCSVVVIDLKADSLELLATLDAVQARVRRERGRELPLKVFSNQKHRSFAFNPMRQPFWRSFDLITQADILCGATGLTYGTDYGQGYYSTANAAVLYHTLKTFPGVASFAEIASAIGTVLESAKKRELNPEIRKAGVHVQEVMKRLAACEPLNVTESSGIDPAVLAYEIDLASVYTGPQLLYFHLSAILSPSGAPEMARLVAYVLLAAATQTQRQHPVYLVIDEFQRMVAANLEYIMQLARSMDVGVILGNQAMSDLRKGTTDLTPALETNCRVRQWLAVSSLDDMRRVVELSGLTIDYEQGCSVTVNAQGEKSVTQSLTEKVVPRFTINDVAMTTDDKFRSIVKVSRGDGYAQYRGLPVIIESGYHISAEEYARRRAFPWPDLLGSFLPGTRADFTPVAVSNGPVWSEEILSPTSSVPMQPEVAAELASLFEALPAPPAPTRKRRKRS